MILFSLLRLLCWASVSVTDNILGATSPGSDLLSAPSHVVSRNRMRNERMRETDKRAEDKTEQNQPSLQPDRAGAGPNWGDLYF